MLVLKQETNASVRCRQAILPPKANTHALNTIVISN